jgi:hypothetical protein
MEERTILEVKGKIIRQPSNMLSRFFHRKRVAKCKTEQWAKDLASAYNMTNGMTSNTSDISVDYFEQMVARGVSEVEAAVITLQYLSGFFAKHIQGSNMQHVAKVLLNQLPTD